MLRGIARSDGLRRRGTVGGQSLVAGSARRRASLPLMTDGAPGHGGEHRPPFSAVTGRTRYPGGGMRRVGEADVPVRFRRSRPGSIGETIPPGLRRIGGLAMTSGAIPGRRRPGICGVRTVAGGACAFRDGHMAVVPKRPFTRSARYHQYRGKQNEGEHAVADFRHASDRTGDHRRGQARGDRSIESRRRASSSIRSDRRRISSRGRAGGDPAPG